MLRRARATTAPRRARRPRPQPSPDAGTVFFRWVALGSIVLAALWVLFSTPPDVEELSLAPSDAPREY